MEYIRDKLDNYLLFNYKGFSLVRIFYCLVVVVLLDSFKYFLIIGDIVNSVNFFCVIFLINECFFNDWIVLSIWGGDSDNFFKIFVNVIGLFIWFNWVGFM